MKFNVLLLSLLLSNNGLLVGTAILSGIALLILDKQRIS